jgi:prevent-host-death family protein
MSAMETEVSLDEAQVRLEELVQAVEQGRSFVITRDGKPIARLAPAENASLYTPRRVLTPEQEAARERARECMRKGLDLGGAKFSRDELYER